MASGSEEGGESQVLRGIPTSEPPATDLGNPRENDGLFAAWWNYKNSSIAGKMHLGVQGLLIVFILMVLVVPLDGIALLDPYEEQLWMLKVTTCFAVPFVPFFLFMDIKMGGDKWRSSNFLDNDEVEKRELNIIMKIGVVIVLLAVLALDYSGLYW